eukprot:670185-Amphidinium_carterae.2
MLPQDSDVCLHRYSWLWLLGPAGGGIRSCTPCKWPQLVAHHLEMWRTILSNRRIEDRDISKPVQAITEVGRNRAAKAPRPLPLQTQWSRLAVFLGQAHCIMPGSVPHMPSKHT